MNESFAPRSGRPRFAAKALIAAGVGAALALAVPLAASAHVAVSPNQAEPGSYALLTFKVPNESETATTTSIEVDLPTDTPFTSVRYVPVSGWTAQLVTETLPKPVKIGENSITEAVTKVIWTADAGAEIADGQLQQFSISAGPIPDTGSIELPAIQTYSDGSVVSWSEAGESAEHPAPVLFINDAPVAEHDDDGDGDATVTADHGSDSDQSATTTTGAVAADDGVARGLGIGGLALGAIALVLAAYAAFRRRPAAEAPADTKASK